MTHILSWDEPEGITARGTLVVLPGRGEEPGVYQRFGRRIAADGYRVRAVGDPTSDLEAVTAQLKTILTDAQSPQPRVVVGSDAGALAALRVVATSSVPVDALILAGLPDLDYTPAVDLDTWESEAQARTSCPTHRGLIADEELLDRGALTPDRVPQALRESIHLEAVDLPVLGLHGVDDEISPLSNAAPLYARLPNSRLVGIDDGRHDVLNAAVHRTVAATVVLFLEDLRRGAGADPIARPADLARTSAGGAP
jgi:alpha-beta hydrolase superfamily lysophospholipase